MRFYPKLVVVVLCIVGLLASGVMAVEAKGLLSNLVKMESSAVQSAQGGGQNVKHKRIDRMQTHRAVAKTRANKGILGATAASIAGHSGKHRWAQQGGDPESSGRRTDSGQARHTRGGSGKHR